MKFTFNAKFPVENQINEAFNIGTDRTKWLGNIVSNSNKIKQHLVQTIGTDATLLRAVPNPQAQFGYQEVDNNGYDLLDQHLGRYDQMPDCRKMINDYKHILPTS